MPKVDFFIVGAPKAGTTSLYHYLDKHPNIEMSNIKEPNYFSSEDLKLHPLYYQERIIDNLAEYEALFSKNQSDIKSGEASVSYLYYNRVPQKILEYNKNAKIVIMLRNPVDRAFSHWQMDERLGYINQPLEEVVTNHESSKNKLYYQQYIQLGLYFEQVERYLKVFGSNNVLILIQEEFKINRQSVLDKLYKFLKIPSIILEDSSEHNTARRFDNPIFRTLYTNKNIRSIVKNVLPDKFTSSILTGMTSSDDRKISADLFVQLQNIFKEDIVKLRNLIDIDLSIWEKL
jgi:hypothetical protein